MCLFTLLMRYSMHKVIVINLVSQPEKVESLRPFHMCRQGDPIFTNIQTDDDKNLHSPVGLIPIVRRVVIFIF